MQHLIGICTTETPMTNNEFQLFPIGLFRTQDGRPKEAPGWQMNATIAARLIAAFNTQKNPIVVDYEHQTFTTKENGKPAPAAGWVHGLEWREGKGLFAVGVKWTDAARASIQSDEYRYISPVFLYNQQSGEVTSLLNAALTNRPALDGMEAAVALRMEFEAQGRELDSLRLEQAQGALDTEIKSALAECRLLPWQEAAARQLGALDRAALKTILDRPPFIRPGSTQTDEIGMEKRMGQRNAAVARLTAADLRMCELSGRSPEEFAALKTRFNPDD